MGSDRAYYDEETAVAIDNTPLLSLNKVLASDADQITMLKQVSNGLSQIVDRLSGSKPMKEASDLVQEPDTSMGLVGVFSSFHHNRNDIINSIHKNLEILDKLI